MYLVTCNHCSFSEKRNTIDEALALEGNHLRANLRHRCYVFHQIETKESRSIDQKLLDLGDLSTELNLWYDSQQLPHESADEALYNEKLTDEQRAWLTRFIHRWEYAMREEER